MTKTPCIGCGMTYMVTPMDTGTIAECPRFSFFLGRQLLKS